MAGSYWSIGAGAGSAILTMLSLVTTLFLSSRKAYHAAPDAGPPAKTGAPPPAVSEHMAKPAETCPEQRSQGTASGQAAPAPPRQTPSPLPAYRVGRGFHTLDEERPARYLHGPLEATTLNLLADAICTARGSESYGRTVHDLAQSSAIWVVQLEKGGYEIYFRAEKLYSDAASVLKRVCEEKERKRRESQARRRLKACARGKGAQEAGEPGQPGARPQTE